MSRTFTAPMMLLLPSSLMALLLPGVMGAMVVIPRPFRTQGLKWKQLVPLCILCEIDLEHLCYFVFVEVSNYCWYTFGWSAFCDEPLRLLEKFLQQLQSHEFSSCLSCISIFSCSSTSLSNTINTPWRQLEKELSPNYSQVTRQQRKVVTTT